LKQISDSKSVQHMADADWVEAKVAQRTRELAAAFAVCQEIVAQLDLDQILHSVTTRARALLQARVGLLCLLTADGQALELAASSGQPDIELGLRLSLQREPARQVVGDGQPLLTQSACAACCALRRVDPGHAVIAPLRAGANTLGALCLVRDDIAPFDADQMRSLMLLANAAAIAITNARLAVAACQAAAQSAACAERAQLAAELHDHLAQTLGYLNLKTAQLQASLDAGSLTTSANELMQIKSAITDAYMQVRTLLTGLRRPPSDAADLAEKLADCVASLRTDTGPTIDLVVTKQAALALPPVMQTQVLHIIREALTNVQRHARARRIRLCVECSEEMACFTVEDDGCGFDPDAATGDHHLGLLIMRTRAERSGGQLLIESAPGAGTKLLLRLPLPARVDR
jgi:two-component system, NarL family, nitrate/nitrite sensor histidine kinase NarX